MKTKKVYIKCFGCQMNKLDSSLVASALKDAGFETTENAAEADVVLINTCSVREHAEDALHQLGIPEHEALRLVPGDEYARTQLEALQRDGRLRSVKILPGSQARQPDDPLPSMAAEP